MILKLTSSYYYITICMSYWQRVKLSEYCLPMLRCILAKWLSIWLSPDEWSRRHPCLSESNMLLSSCNINEDSRSSISPILSWYLNQGIIWPLSQRLAQELKNLIIVSSLANVSSFTYYISISVNCGSISNCSSTFKSVLILIGLSASSLTVDNGLRVISYFSWGDSSELQSLDEYCLSSLPPSGSDAFD